MKTFEDELDTAIITTKFVIEGKSPILYVNHFEDGYWQFSGCEENAKDEDYRIISLGEAIQIDSSIIEVSDLPYDGKAYRECVNSKWKVIPFPRSVSLLHRPCPPTGRNT